MKAALTSCTSPSNTGTHDPVYEQFLRAIRNCFDAHLHASDYRLFTTDATELFDTFLDGLPEADRQHYTCRACQHFVDKFGGIVRIDEKGDTHPVMWPAHASAVPEYFFPAMQKAHARVKKARVTGVFLNSETVWGTPSTNGWSHMAISMLSPLSKKSFYTDGQLMAEKKQEFVMVMNAILEFPLDTVREAVRVLSANALYRSEKFLGPAEFLLNLHQKRQTTKNTRQKENMTWSAVSAAPAGFCHVKSTIVGSLLEDINAGYDYATVKARFDEKTDPLKYQRPQVAPSEGNIRQAEDIIEKLGLARSFARRVASLSDVRAFWVPRNQAPVAGKPVTEAQELLARVRPAPKTEKAQLDLPAVTMTWAKFQREVLPQALSMEILLPPHGNYVGLLTATDLSAPPILKWDHDDNRNPVSWYMYSGGSPISRWEVSAGYAPVAAISAWPCHWKGETPGYSQGLIFFVEGMRDTSFTGLALFPEILRSELHGIRGTIESLSNTGTPDKAISSPACGLGWSNGSYREVQLRVSTAAGRMEYVLDRME